MNKPGSALALGSAAALLTVSLYDASLPTQALGLRVAGNEAVIAVGSLSLAAALTACGLLGLRRTAPPPNLPEAR